LFGHDLHYTQTCITGLDCDLQLLRISSKSNKKATAEAKTDRVTDRRRPICTGMCHNLWHACYWQW